MNPVHFLTSLLLIHTAWSNEKLSKVLFPENPLVSIPGMTLRIIVFVQKGLIPFHRSEVRQIFTAANKITSSQMNVHLQVTRFVEDVQFPENERNGTELRTKKQLKKVVLQLADAYRQNTTFDHAILFHFDSEGALSPNAICTHNSASALPVGHPVLGQPKLTHIIHPKPFQVRLVAKDIFNLMMKDSFRASDKECNCADNIRRSDSHRVCLSDDNETDEKKMTKSILASNCFKKELMGLLTSKNPARPSKVVANYHCLKRTPVPSETDVPICGNGIQEVDKYPDKKYINSGLTLNEGCDFFRHDYKLRARSTQETCAWKNCGANLDADNQIEMMFGHEDDKLKRDMDQLTTPHPEGEQLESVVLIFAILITCLVLVALVLITLLILSKGRGHSRRGSWNPTSYPDSRSLWIPSPESIELESRTASPTGSLQASPRTSRQTPIESIEIPGDLNLPSSESVLRELPVSRELLMTTFSPPSKPT
jgi:hypothetical protein